MTLQKHPSDLPVYLVVGKDDFLKDEFIHGLRGQIFSNSDAALNFQEFTAGRDALGAAFDFLRTAPFLGEKRLAVLRSMDELDAEEKKSVDAYVESPSPTGVLVLVSEEGSVKKDAYLRKLSKKTKLISCYTPFDKDLPSWTENRIKKYAKTIDKNAVRVLIERTAKNVSALAVAAEQLSVYIGDRSRIETADVEALLGRSIQGDVYDLVDRLVEKNASKTLDILEMLFREGARFQEIVGALAGQFERLKEASELIGERRSPQEIASILGVHPYYLERVLGQARALPVQKIKEFLRELLKYDESVKTGRMDPKRALERFILEVCS